MKYGELPKELGVFKIECREMMFYQYLPIKMRGITIPVFEKRLHCFESLIGKTCLDFIEEFGVEKYKNSYVYLTAKHLYQPPNTSFNRMGWHSDGFLTEDINYIWCDKFPTIFNSSEFKITLDDCISMREMAEQALEENNIQFKENQLLRLNQFNIHKVAPITDGCMRTFVKLSFSEDKYDLVGNSHNFEIEYNWKMKQRGESRNIPQSKIK